MEIGEIKKVQNKGLTFELKALDEYALIYNNVTTEYEKRQLGEVLEDIGKNPYGIKKGLKMLIAK